MTNYEYLKTLSPQHMAIFLAGVDSYNDIYLLYKDYYEWLQKERTKNEEDNLDIKKLEKLLNIKWEN